MLSMVANVVLCAGRIHFAGTRKQDARLSCSSVHRWYAADLAVGPILDTLAVALTAGGVGDQPQDPGKP